MIHYWKNDMEITNKDKQLIKDAIRFLHKENKIKEFAKNIECGEEINSTPKLQSYMLKHNADRTSFAASYSMSPIAWYFSWANTTQGYDYWCKLSNKFELLYF